MLAALTACAQVGPRNRHFEDPVSPRKEAQVVSAGDQGAAAVLAGTAWRLVEIVSMDDRVDVPDDRSSYTLQFGTDGSFRVRADCNRGTGTYTSANPGQLTFGPIATTRMACPPGSIGSVYHAQFEWVRSYVLEGGNLYLATMADGSIIGFQPTPGGAR